MAMPAPHMDKRDREVDEGQDEIIKQLLDEEQQKKKQKHKAAHGGEESPGAAADSARHIRRRMALDLPLQSPHVPCRARSTQGQDACGD